MWIIPVILPKKLRSSMCLWYNLTIKYTGEMA